MKTKKYAIITDFLSWFLQASVYQWSVLKHALTLKNTLSMMWQDDLLINHNKVLGNYDPQSNLTDTPGKIYLRKGLWRFKAKC